MCTNYFSCKVCLALLLFLSLGCERPDGTNLPPDNTAVNERDGDSTHPTPEQQGTSDADMELTSKIRARINNVEDFSTYAKNIKIISLKGHVTLRGPVASEHERDVIANIAGEIAGPRQVHNQLEVARN